MIRVKKELEHHYIEGSYGGNQEWFNGPMMKLGGCGAETACECCIYFSMHYGLDLYPFDLNNLTVKDYKQFGAIMKPYLSPRMTGIDRLDIFIDGFRDYIRDRLRNVGMGQDIGETEDARMGQDAGETEDIRIKLSDIGNANLPIRFTEFSGEEDVESAIKVIKEQIDRGLPIPMLMLNHRDKRFKDYDWHWFIVNGYAEGTKAPPPGPWSDAGCEASNSVSPDGSERFYIKTATYSEWDWLDFKDFWDTGHSRKGGLVIMNIDATERRTGANEH